MSACKPYLTLLCGLSALVLCLVAGLNYLVDPYLIHQWNTEQLQRLRPPREKLLPWAKTYAIARFRPDVVYLGNSRTELGLPARWPLFGRSSVFNAALSGASVGDTIAMAAFAARMGSLKTVVWGIDAPSFSLTGGATELTPELVADGPAFFARRALLDVRRGLTFDMTADSLRLLAGTFGAVCRSSLVFYGQRDERCIESRLGGWRATREAMSPRLGEFIRGEGPSTAAMSAFDASVGALCHGGARLRLYINPTHALTLDGLYWSGKWAAMEAWQRALVAMTARHRRAGCDLRLVDFSGYNSITAEAIPPAEQHGTMAFYWELSHYRANVGRLILARLFGDARHGTADAVPDDFGIELDARNVDGHLADLRAARERYQAAHPVELAFVRKTVAAVLPGAQMAVGVPPLALARSLP